MSLMDVHGPGIWMTPGRTGIHPDWQVLRPQTGPGIWRHLAVQVSIQTGRCCVLKPVQVFGDLWPYRCLSRVAGAASSNRSRYLTTSGRTGVHPEWPVLRPQTGQGIWRPLAVQVSIKSGRCYVLKPVQVFGDTWPYRCPSRLAGGESLNQIKKSHRAGWVD